MITLCIFLLLFNKVTGSSLVEFDIKLTDKQKEIYYGTRNLRSLGTYEDDDLVGFWRNHHINGSYHIPVVFDEDDPIEGTNQMTQEEADDVLSKMKAMEDKLDNVITFVTEFDPADYPDGYIRVGTFGSGCWSYHKPHQCIN